MGFKNRWNNSQGSLQNSLSSAFDHLNLSLPKAKPYSLGLLFQLLILGPLNGHLLASRHLDWLLLIWTTHVPFTNQWANNEPLIGIAPGPPTPGNNVVVTHPVTIRARCRRKDNHERDRRGHLSKSSTQSRILSDNILDQWVIQHPGISIQSYQDNMF